jgi:hypothetical protein
MSAGSREAAARRRRLRWLRETRDVGIPLDLAIAAAPLVAGILIPGHHFTFEGGGAFTCRNCGDALGAARPRCPGVVSE